MLRSILILVLGFVASLLPGLLVAADEEVRIGVLAKRGDVHAHNQWIPTAEYLSAQLPGHHFRIVALDFDEIGPAVRDGGVEFVLANSAIYVELEYRYGAARIATMRNRLGGYGSTRFGGVIFTRAEEEGIQRLEDLRGKHFGAVQANSFGGWLMGWYELRRQGLEPKRAFRSVQFLGTHDAVVYGVLNGLVAGGTVRTDTLERMANEGLIDLAQIRVLGPHEHPDFAYRVSTGLYPEWPMARVRHTPEQLGHEVALALIRMPAESEAARQGNVTGWTIPLDYQPVHELMRELRVGPYEVLGEITWTDLWTQYWYWLLALLLLLFGLSGVVAHIWRLNRRLRATERELRHAGDDLAEIVAERTTELEHTLSELAQSHRRLERVSRDWNDAFDAISDPIFIHDHELKVISANPAYCRAAGMGPEEVLNKPYHHVFPRLEQPLSACRHFPEQLNPEGDEVTLDNGEVYISNSFAISKADGVVENAIHILKNVTEERRAEREMQRLNRALRTLSLCNTSLVHAEDEQALLERICRILIDSGGYRFTWVGLLNEQGQLEPVAHAGYNDGFLDEITPLLAQEHERLPATVALERKDICMERDTDHASASSPGWRQAARAHGFASVVAFPLISNDQLFGTLSINALEPDAFDEAEMLLLRELAGDLAFGIRTLRSRIAREQAERNLAATEARYEELYENAPSAYLSVAVVDGRITQCNPALAQMVGQQREALLGQPVIELFDEGSEGRERATSLLGKVRAGEEIRAQELRLKSPGDHPLWVSMNVLPVRDGNGSEEVVECRASLMDISARREAEVERQEFARQLQRSLLQTIRAIALTIEKRDPYTAGHQERVADLAVAIAGRMGLDEERIEGMRLGAMIHDIGKISVPSEILNRPGRLEPELFSIIKAHPTTGYDIVKGIEFPWPLAEMVLQHHERLDGSGYPSGLKGEEILLESRIMMVADVVEAMASHRPYRPALGPDAALDEIRRGRGEQYDREVVDACLALYEEGRLNWIDERRD